MYVCREWGEGFCLRSNRGPVFFLSVSQMFYSLFLYLESRHGEWFYLLHYFFTIPEQGLHLFSSLVFSDGLKIKFLHYSKSLIECRMESITCPM